MNNNTSTRQNRARNSKGLWSQTVVSITQCFAPQIIEWWVATKFPREVRKVTTLFPARCSAASDEKQHHSGQEAGVRHVLAKRWPTVVEFFPNLGSMLGAMTGATAVSETIALAEGLSCAKARLFSH